VIRALLTCLLLVTGTASAEIPYWPITMATTFGDGSFEYSINIASVVSPTPGRFIYRFSRKLPTSAYQVKVRFLLTSSTTPLLLTLIRAKISNQTREGFTLDAIDTGQGDALVAQPHTVFVYSGN